MRAFAEILGVWTVSAIAAVYTGRWLRIIALRYTQARDDRRYGPLSDLPERSRSRRARARVIRIDERRRDRE